MHVLGAFGEPDWLLPIAAYIVKVWDFIVNLSVDVRIAGRDHHRSDTGRSNGFPGIIGKAMGVTV